MLTAGRGRVAAAICERVGCECSFRPAGSPFLFRFEVGGTGGGAPHVRIVSERDVWGRWFVCPFRSVFSIRRGEKRTDLAQAQNDLQALPRNAPDERPHDPLVLACLTTVGTIIQRPAHQAQPHSHDPPVASHLRRVEQVHRKILRGVLEEFRRRSEDGLEGGFQRDSRVCRAGRWVRVGIGGRRRKREGGNAGGGQGEDRVRRVVKRVFHSQRDASSGRW